MRSICEIPKDWFVMNVNLNGDEPYATACEKGGIMREEKFSIPYALSYFLLTHWAGTDELKMMHRHELANEIKRLLSL